MSDNKDNNPEEVPPYEMEIAPIQQITRAEIDVQIATAKANPRDLAKFYKRAEAMVTIDQETAESCFYQIRRRDKRTGETKIIEGESIRMAEIVAACFGNLRSAVHIVGHTPTRVSVRGVCHDLETNNLIAVEKQAKTAYSDGSPYNEDMAITTANALVSKTLRDAIFRVVPKALLKPLKEKAKLVAFGQGQAFVDRRKRAIDWVTLTRKVPLDRVLAALGVASVENMTVEHLEILTGLKNGIMDGDQTVDDAFPPLDSGTESLPKENPEKKKQEEQKQQLEQELKKTAKKAKEKAAEVGATGEVKPSPVTTPEPKKEEPTKTEPKKTEEAPVKPGNVVEMPKKEEAGKTEEQELGEMGLAPEPKKDEAVEKELTANQKALKEVLESNGVTFTDLIAAAAGKFLPAKSHPQCPKSWADIDDAKAGVFFKSYKGIVASVNTYKKSKGK